jgi:phage terminase small subunit
VWIVAKLTSKQKRFVDEYLIDLNATQAAIRAGYSLDTARAIGCENLTKPNIQNAIDAAKARRQVLTEVTQEWVIKNLVEVVNRSMEAAPVRNKRGELVTTHSADGELQAVFGYDSKGANTALKTLAEHLGMIKQNVNIDLKGTIALEDLIDDDDVAPGQADSDKDQTDYPVRDNE